MTYKLNTKIYRNFKFQLLKKKSDYVSYVQRMTEKEKKIFERCIQHFLGFESAEQYVTENKNCELQNSSIIILLIE